jgi:signal transduction histidine kinase
MSLSTDRRRLALLLGLLAVLAVLLTGAVVALSRTNWVKLYQVAPGSSGARLRWTTNESVYFAAGWVSVLVAQLSGLWLWWRAPRNATGRWLWLAGLSLGFWFLGTYWPSPWGMQLWWTIYLFRPALAMAFLGWPTGRPSRQIRRWIVALTVIPAALAFVTNLFGRAAVHNAWPQDPLRLFTVGWVGPVFGSITGWLFFFIPALAIVVILVRRRRGLPKGARRLMTPITVAGVLVASSDLLTGIGTLNSNLTWDQTANHATVLGTVNFTQNYLQAAIAAVGLLVAFSYRERAVREGERHLELDLGRAAALAAPSAAMVELLDDPTARILYLRLNGTWVDADGRSVVVGTSDHRMVTPVEAPDGTTLAAIETDAAKGTHPSLIEIGAATVAARLANERATAVAKARLLELTALQLALLDTTDAAREHLERDLHDGAQQQLVGVILAARLAERDSAPAASERVREALGAARAALVELLDGGVPVVLTSGLASALTTLAAMTPLDAEARVRGDLDPEDRLARTAWLIASEAVANTVKHAGASRLCIDLTVDKRTATLRLTDDGCGGVTTPPQSITDRASESGGTVTVRSPIGGGTELVVVFERPESAVAA